MELFAMAHVYTQDRPSPLIGNCFNPTHSYCPLICYVIDIVCYFFNLFYLSMSYSVTVPTIEFDYLYILYYINFLFSPVTVSFYFSSMAKLRFVSCCTNKRI